MTDGAGRPLEEVQDELLDAVHAGKPIDRAAVLAEHPQHADALERFFALLDEIEPPGEAAGPAHIRLGEFRLLREIGRGGMGIVHEAEQTSLKRRVALKVLPAVLASNERVVARFRREAEAAGRLRHPNIVPVYAVGSEGGLPFFAMELVSGRSLAEILQERNAGSDADLPPAGSEWRNWACTTIAAVADALEYAHDQGILHRDVKPGNILLEESGTPRLTDFGLALDLDAPGLTASGETFGTPLYMSPEQAIRREAPLDRRTDVYSLGVTLYETLLLRGPYTGTSMVEILGALQSGSIVPPREVDPTLPASLEAIILRALAKDPSDRYATAGELAADLRSAVSGRAVSSRAVESAPAQGRTRAPLIALVAAVLLGVGILASSPWSDAEPAPPGAGDRDEGVATWDDVLAGDPAAAHLLDEAIQISSHMRSVVARSRPATLELEVAFDGGRPAGDADFVVFSIWEAQTDGGEWRELRRMKNAPGPGGQGGTRFGIPMDEVLGDALGSGSAGVGLRLSSRYVRRPPSTERFAGGGDFVGEPSEWVDEGGSVFTWEEYQTVLIYDDFPAEYPEAVSTPEVDREMQASLTPDAIESLSIGASRRFSVDLSGIDRAARIPTACEVDLCREDSDEVIATAVFTRPASTDEDADEDVMQINISFWFHDPPPPDEQRFALDVAARRIPRAKLVFRGSRRVALEHTAADRYWAGRFDVTLPVDSFAGVEDDGTVFQGPGPDDVISFGKPAEVEHGSDRWPDPNGVSTSVLEDLVGGTCPDGEEVLAEWLHARVRMRSLIMRDHLDRSIQLQLRRGRVFPDVGEAKRATLRVKWEMSAGGPWLELDESESWLFGSDPVMQESTEPLGPHLGAEAMRDELTLRFRAHAWIVRGPERAPNQPEPGPEAWEAISDQGTRCTLEFERKLRLCERYPDAYPRALDDAATDAAVREWLRPKCVRWGGMGTSFLETFGHFPLEFEIVGDAPVPIAAEIEVWDPITDRHVATSDTIELTPGQERKWPWKLNVRMEVNDPPSADDLQLAKDIISGKQSQLRVVFRGTRDAARGARTFVADTYWKGEVDLTLPARGE